MIPSGTQGPGRAGWASEDSDNDCHILRMPGALTPVPDFCTVIERLLMFIGELKGFEEPGGELYFNLV
ncbi:hypothetical protein NDU88_002407 [Pleurodeles waltl]|uniref:Uncharacterized protein n=1 Tax=Pleurodeles waltl TaxID=8319 RepID=A0AAV7QCT5_PLEWA|nr:hypothetical protein NDU88_002407 [Pleurodeles waltl]